MKKRPAAIYEMRRDGALFGASVQRWPHEPQSNQRPELPL
jgi:hypothetical protein